MWLTSKSDIEKNDPERKFKGSEKRNIFKNEIIRVDLSIYAFSKWMINYIFISKVT